MAAVAPTPWNADAIRHRVGVEPDFHREYMGQFPEQTKAEILAEGLWAQYHLACERFDRVVCSKEYRDWWIKQFTSAAYGWAWKCESQVARWFDEELQRLESGGVDQSS